MWSKEDVIISLASDNIPKLKLAKFVQLDNNDFNMYIKKSSE
jgi:hypothetical protein